MFEILGAIHIHSHYSDGSGSLREIIKSAQEAELDYIIITDHNTIRAKKEHIEGWHGKTLVLVGEEISGRAGHCLALNISSRISGRRKKPEQYLIDIHKHQGLSFIAHPHFGSNWQFAIRNVSWKNWNVPEFTGIELWSYLADWAKDLTWLNFAKRWLNPQHTISGPSLETIKKWDELTQTRRVVAIGGVDAHAKVLTPFKRPVILPYHQVFKTIRTHILLSAPLSYKGIEDAKRVYQALKSGHVFLANDGIALSSGFNFVAVDKKEKILGIMGDELCPSFPIYCHITIPIHDKYVMVKLVKDGQVIYREQTHKIVYKLNSPGVYRVEVTYHRHPWIYSNPIYLRATSLK
ncbi:MAG: CehA/McbA family metallohydrolase [bacterium]|nr:CehA/McbA family metallohydrolase [bacterium]